MRSNEKKGAGLRRRRQRGVHLIEFLLVLLPLLAFMGVLMDASWAIFVKATLQYAVRTGVRTGITITGTQATAANQTLVQMVKSTVQANSLGLLNGATGLSYIQVNFFAQDSSSSTGLTNVNSSPTGNVSPNIMQVSVNGFPLAALFPRFFNWHTPVDLAKTKINAMAADEIEPSSDVPTMGTAP